MKTITLANTTMIRLVNAAYHAPPRLPALSLSERHDATNSALMKLTEQTALAQDHGLPELDPRELVWRRASKTLQLYGDHLINAAFTSTRPSGNRFNTANRGAWYAADSADTAIAEVCYHKRRELDFIGRTTDDPTQYLEILADFSGTYPSLVGEPDHPALGTHPETAYRVGQALALSLQRAGQRGLQYPSVRAEHGLCFVAFDPQIVQNVRTARCWWLRFETGQDVTLAKTDPAGDQQ